MNTFKASEAVIHYGPADFTILEPGHYVKCAVTGERISIEHLKYWSHVRQEAYVDAAASLQAFQKAAR